MALTLGGETHHCDKLKELADATSLTLKLIDQGFRLHKVDEFTAGLRLTICEGCVEGWIPEERRCAKCCCPMDFKVTLKYDPIKGIMKKTPIQCPIGKW
jgi:hypothetical protein